ncbi:MAG TPA: ATP-binding protein [Verrucomicrobiae bacterium]|jgi:heavy metal sensor kinase
MNIFKSIKWRLQLWYGLILVIVLAGFGVTAYQLERGRQLGRIDDELHRRFDILSKSLHGPPGQRGDRRRFDRPPPGQLPEDEPPDPAPNQAPNRPQKFELPPPVASLFDASSPNNFYFIILGRDGEEIARSENAPAKGSEMDHFMATESPLDAAPGNPSKPPPPENFHTDRVISRHLPSGEKILTGASLAPENRELKTTTLELSLAGAIILVLGLTGGWWFVSRALQPVENISATAVKISAGDLSQRINVAETESELGQLAAVLNSTFARLDAAFAQQKQFASDAAHELRTPVTVILTQTQTALNREREAASYKQTLEACQRAAQRMRKLIESLLALARLDAGQEVLKRLRFDLAKTVDDAVALVEPIAAGHGIRLLTELEPLEINGDSERLAQVVTNLLTNAIQYNHPQGEVRVQLKAENRLAILSIADSGYGIAAEHLPRVFERFYRADRSRTGAGNTGLGLAICQAIVTAHGGTMEVSSEENVGTTFTVRLPI